jgi:hypothetical protein
LPPPLVSRAASSSHRTTSMRSSSSSNCRYRNACGRFVGVRMRAGVLSIFGCASCLGEKVTACACLRKRERGRQDMACCAWRERDNTRARQNTASARHIRHPMQCVRSCLPTCACLTACMSTVTKPTNRARAQSMQRKAGCAGRRDAGTRGASPPSPPATTGEGRCVCSRNSELAGSALAIFGFVKCAGTCKQLEAI